MEQLLPQIGLILLLILLNAVFASAEIALVSVRRSRIDVLAKKGDRRAVAVARLLKGDPGRYLAAIQIGVTLAGFLASAIAAVTLAVPLQNLFQAVPVAAVSTNAQGIAVVITTTLIALITLVYGELVPKRVALQAAERVALLLGRPIHLFSRVTRPVILLLTTATNYSLRLLGFKPGVDEDQVTEDELKQIIANQSTLDREEQRLLWDVFDFGDAVAYDVMVPRTDVVGVEISTSVADTLYLMSQTGHSRIPVYGQNLDNIIGIAGIKDLVPYLLRGEGGTPVEKVVRPAYVVPNTVPIRQLLRDLQKRGVSMAVIVDEFGGTDGVVTVETLLEELVGEIRDEYDREDQEILSSEDGQAIVKGSAGVDEVNRQLKLAIPESEEYNTVAGFILDQLNKVPKVGDRVTLNGAVLEVAKMKANRILMVSIKKES
ncbi:MAG: hemolysin family protein [Bacillota bacterium]